MPSVQPRCLLECMRVSVELEVGLRACPIIIATTMAITRSLRWQHHNHSSSQPFLVRVCQGMAALLEETAFANDGRSMPYGLKAWTSEGKLERSRRRWASKIICKDRRSATASVRSSQRSHFFRYVQLVACRRYKAAKEGVDFT